jgi:RecJ-like exonuclease
VGAGTGYGYDRLPIFFGGCMSETDKCECCYCGDCDGTGRVRVEWDLEPCSNCDGTGIVELCDRCEEIEEEANDGWY